MSKRTLVFGSLTCVVLLAASAGADEVKVSGRVVDRDGKPVPAAEVATFWMAGDDKPMTPIQGVKTDAEGRFSLEVELYGRDGAVMAIQGEQGGIATIEANAPDRVLEIKAAPLRELKGHFTCDELGKPPGWTNVYVSLLPGMTRIAEMTSTASKFALKLPPGHYHFNGYGDAIQFTSDQREIELEPGKPGRDLGAVDLKLKPLAKLFGKEPPPLTVTDARGVPKDVKLTDFRGKWVVLDFWGFWCGPCVARSLPGWMDFAEEHRSDQDRFVILTIHDPQATDFAMLDQKLEPIIRSVWRGRTLPFPILLDTTGETVKNYGISSWPTSLVIDPEGKLVRLTEPAEAFLEGKLTPIPLEKRLTRALDSDVSLGLQGGSKPALLAKFFSGTTRIKLTLDESEFKAAGLSPDVVIPIELVAKLSLRSWLNLTLGSLGMTYVASDGGLKIVRRTGDNGALSLPSDRQRSENARVASVLQKPVTLDVHDQPLRKLLKKLEGETSESFVLDPQARRTGALRDDIKVNGKLDGPLANSLRSLLETIGLTYVVRDEAVVILPRP